MAEICWGGACNVMRVLWIFVEEKKNIGGVIICVFLSLCSHTTERLEYLSCLRYLLLLRYLLWFLRKLRKLIPGLMRHPCRSHTMDSHIFTHATYVHNRTSSCIKRSQLARAQLITRWLEVKSTDHLKDGRFWKVILAELSFTGFISNTNSWQLAQPACRGRISTSDRKSCHLV